METKGNPFISCIYVFKNMILKARRTEGGRLRLLIPYPQERRKRVKIVIGEWSPGFKKLAKKSDLLVLASPKDLKRSWKKGAFLVKGPGEYEVKGIFVTGIADSGEGPVYVIQGEGNRYLYISSFERELETEAWEKIGEIDILFAPLDRENLPAAKKMKNVISQVEPQGVVFLRKEKVKRKDKIKEFLKEADIKTGKECQELSFDKSDLGPDKIAYFVLSEER